MNTTKLILLILFLSGISNNICLSKKHVSTEIIPIYQHSDQKDVLLIAIKFIINKHWHVYWRNSGDSGLPTDIKLKLPEGITQGDYFWPAPKLIKTENIADFAYEDSVFIFTELQLNGQKQFQITSFSDYLVCNDVCIPEKDTAKAFIDLTLESTSFHKPVGIDYFLNSVPDTSGKVKSKAYKTKNYIDLSLPKNIVNLSIDKQFHFYPYEAGYIEHSGYQMHKFLKDELRLIIPRAQIPFNDPENLEGILTYSDYNGKPKSIYLKTKLINKED